MLEVNDLIMIEETVTSSCPTCSAVRARTTYEVGSGPELSCLSCDWCWGANGQLLTPLEADEAGINASIAQAKINAPIASPESKSGPICLGDPGPAPIAQAD